MARANSDVRHQLVLGAADLIGRRGLRASTVRDLARHSQTPEGSIYHYFPGGKQELAAEAVRLNGELVGQVVSGGLEEGPLAGLRALIAAVRELITGTDFQGGCPVLAVAVEGRDGGETTPALAAAAEVFGRWSRLIARSLERHGVPESRSGRIGTLVFAALEGAFAMCRAQQSIEPLEDVSAELEAIVTAVVSDRRGTAPEALPASNI